MSKRAFESKRLVDVDGWKLETVESEVESLCLIEYEAGVTKHAPFDGDDAAKLYIRLSNGACTNWRVYVNGEEIYHPDSIEIVATGGAEAHAIPTAINNISRILFDHLYVAKED